MAFEKYKPRGLFSEFYGIPIELTIVSKYHHGGRLQKAIP